MASIKHGANLTGNRTKLYGRWLTIRNKCTNPNHQAYKWYGAKGIKVCERWNDFAKFKEDVGEIPGPGYSLDRINGKGDYEPGNVRWATAETQSNNKPASIGSRGVHLVTLPDGREMSIAKAEREFGFKKNLIKTRIQKGWAKEYWFDPPGTSATSWRQNRTYGKNVKLIDTPWGEMSVADAARKANMNIQTLHSRIRLWPQEKWFS